MLAPTAREPCRKQAHSSSPAVRLALVTDNLAPAFLISQYLDYKGLKKFLKKQTEDAQGNRREWDDTDEAQFVRELEMELEKIAGFQDRKVCVEQGRRARPCLHAKCRD